MGSIISLLFWLAATLGAVALWVQFLARYYRVPQQPDALHFVPTADGWRITLARYLPSGTIDGALPVVLCAGAGSSSAVFDLQHKSLARFLADQGHDTWMLDLRGRQPDPAQQQRNWSFDDYAEFDVPAALEQIAAITGARQVQWVGFGMGAVAIYPILSGPKAQFVKSVVALAAPVFFGRQQVHFSPGQLRALRWIPLKLTVRLLAPLLGRLYWGPLTRLVNRDNVDGHVFRTTLVNCTADFGRTELLQYAEWLERDSFTAIERREDYRGPMAAISTPTLFISGTSDPFAPPEMVEASAKLLGESELHAVLVAGRHSGMSANYGHLDLLIGRGAVRDIYSHVLRWLDKHCGAPVEMASRPVPPRRANPSLEGTPNRDKRSDSAANTEAQPEDERRRSLAFLETDSDETPT